MTSAEIGPQPKLLQLDSGGEGYRRLLGGPPDTVSMRSGLVVLDPGNSVGLHDTGGNEEMILVLQGQGELLLRDREALLLREGSAAYVPPLTPHDVRNTGEGPLRYVYVVARASA